MLTPVKRRLHLQVSPLNRLSSPMDASKRLRCWMRGGLWSLLPVPGAGILTRLDEYCDAGQGVGKGVVGVALIPSQVSPASNSWSAVNPLRSTAGWPLSVVEVSPQAVLGSFELGL